MARKWLGSLKATKKASATGPAPRIAAMTTSRIKPVSRETSVSPPTVAMRLIIVVFRAAWSPSPFRAREVKEFQRLDHAGACDTVTGRGGPWAAALRQDKRRSGKAGAFRQDSAPRRGDTRGHVKELRPQACPRA